MLDTAPSSRRLSRRNLIGGKLLRSCCCCCCRCCFRSCSTTLKASMLCTCTCRRIGFEKSSPRILCIWQEKSSISVTFALYNINNATRVCRLVNESLIRQIVIQVIYNRFYNHPLTFLHNFCTSLVAAFKQHPRQHHHHHGHQQQLRQSSLYSLLYGCVESAGVYKLDQLKQSSATAVTKLRHLAICTINLPCTLPLSAAYDATRIH